MKGSIKVKFDFGWAMSVIVAILLVVGVVARVSFTYSVQAKAQEICKTQSREVSAHYGKDDPVFNYPNFLQSCKAAKLKPNMQILMDFNAWTYEDVYPDLNTDPF